MNRNKDSWTSKLYEYRVRVEHDDDPQDPREDCEPAGTMVCWHSRYRLGDKVPNVDRGGKLSSKDTLLKWVDRGGPSDFFLILAQDVVSSRYPEALLLANAEKIARAHFIILPLILYDHSGIAMSTTRSYPFNCPWDSGQVGWIYFPKADLAKESWTVEQATKYLEGEVETYSAYISGECYGFIIERLPLLPEDEEYEEDDWANAEKVESCWGFFGEVYEGAYDPQYLIEADEEEYAASAEGVGI